MTRRLRPARRDGRWIGGMLALAVALGCSRAPAPSDSLELVAARFAPGAPSGPPSADDPAWRSVTLPDASRPGQPAQSTTGWYRIGFDLRHAPTEPQALYVPSLSMNVDLFLNGEWIGNGGRLEPPVARNWNRPLFFPFSATSLRAGPNELLVRLERLPHAEAWLGPLLLGRAESLAPLYERQYFRQITAPRLASALGVVIAALMLAFWYASRDGVYAWFALTTSLWVFASLNFHVRDLPVSSRLWEHAAAISLLLMAASFTIFALRDARRESRTTVRATIGLALVGTLLLSGIPEAWLYPVFTVLAVPAFLVATWAWAITLRHAFGSDRSIFVCYLVAGLLGFGFLGKDLLTHVGILSTDTPALSAFAGPALVLGYGATLMSRFVRAFARASAQNDELEQRVREKQAELEHHFARLRRLEDERLLGHERERIMREMHDGMGGQLVRTLALVEGQEASSAEIAAALRSSLDDMRMVIDSLDPVVDDLATLLGTIRGRLEPGLRRRGLRFVWRVADLPPVPRLGAEEFLHILRIVQEAVTNVLKHAKATAITVRTGEGLDEHGRAGVFVEVRDDGIGLDPSRPRGRGLDNMAWRARRLGGTVEAQATADAQGTIVRLWLPLSGASDEATASR